MPERRGSLNRKGGPPAGMRRDGTIATARGIVGAGFCASQRGLGGGKPLSCMRFAIVTRSRYVTVYLNWAYVLQVRARGWKRTLFGFTTVNLIQVIADPDALFGCAPEIVQMRF